MMEKGVYVVAFSYPVVPKEKQESAHRYARAITKEDIDFNYQMF